MLDLEHRHGPVDAPASLSRPPSRVGSLSGSGAVARTPATWTADRVVSPDLRPRTVSSSPNFREGAAIGCHPN